MLHFNPELPTTLAADGCTEVKLTDVHLHMTGVQDRAVLDVGGSLLFPGPTQPQEQHIEWLQKLGDECIRSCGPGTQGDSTLIKVQGRFFRVQREEKAVDGLWFQLRISASEPPELTKLPTALPKPILQILLDPEIRRGGLIYVCGSAGAGKTTTASATVVSRLLKFGGMAFTIEDPPEMALNGVHGAGYCRQTNVISGDGGGDWAASLRSVLRSQPSATDLILFVGEIRSPEAARTMLQAASNGFLVICTGFASDMVTAVQDLIAKAETGSQQSYANTLAQVLKLVVFQTLRDGRFTIDVLKSDNGASKVAAIIRGGQLTQLIDELTYQRNIIISQAGK
jgi:twitching motility protein PilT